jgi:hypothetical protein
MISQHVLVLLVLLLLDLLGLLLLLLLLVVLMHERHLTVLHFNTAAFMTRKRYTP